MQRKRVGFWRTSALVLVTAAVLLLAVLPVDADVSRSGPARVDTGTQPGWPVTVEDKGIESSGPRDIKSPPDDDLKPIKPEVLPPQQEAIEPPTVPKTPSSRPEYLPGQLVVGMSSMVSVRSQASLFGAHGATVLGHRERGNAYIISVPKGKEVATATALAQEAGIAFVEPIYLYYADFVPNDPLFDSEQWHYDVIQMPTAWDLTSGASEIVVAVLDTGLDLTHPDRPINIASGYDMIDNDADPSDDHGHGTHVAGTIAANTNNALGVAGIAWNTTIMPVKVLSPDGGSSIQVSDGIYWAVDHGAHIINMSLGSEYASQLIEDACTYAYNHGVAIVASAGNDFKQESPANYPAAFDHVLAVAATGDHDEHAAYSTAGSYVDIAAPGGNPDSGNDWIWSTTWQGTGEDYCGNAGTSMASPHVAGVLALVKHYNPSLSVDQLYDRVCSTSLDLGDPGRDDLYGWGRIDAYAAITNTDPSPGPGSLPPDAYEPDDTVTEASVIALDATQEDHNIDGLGDQDWLKFTVPTSQHVVIETSGPEGAQDDTMIVLFDESGSQLIAQDDNGGPGSFSYLSLFLEAGTYAVRVSQTGNTATIDNYDITVSGASVPIPEDAWEPDDQETQTTYPMPLDAAQLGRTIHTPTDIDRAQFVVSELSDVVIETQGSGLSDTYVALFDQSWAMQLGWDNDSGTGSYSRLAAQLEPAIYSVLIWEDGQDATIGSYDLNITGSPVAGQIPLDAYEPDDTPAEASWIDLDTVQTRHSLHVKTDHDWAKFTLAQATTVNIETSGPIGANDDTVLELWDESGTTSLGYDDDGGSENYSLLTISLAAGTYAIKARSYSEESQIISYDLSLATVQGLDAYEPDDTVDEASELVGAAQMGHSIHVLADHDWIAFDMVHSGSVAITTNGPVPADTVMELWSDDGTTSIAYDDDSGFENYAMIEVDLGPGRYALEIWEFNDNHLIESYDVTFAFSLAPDAYEHDGNASDATASNLGEEQTHSLHEVGDEDWLQFVVPQIGSPDETHAVTFETNGSSGDTMLFLYDASLTPIASDDDSGEGQFSKIEIGCDEGLEPGTYYLKVQSYPHSNPQDRLVESYTIAGQARQCVTAMPPVQGPGSPWISNFGREAGGWTDFQTYPRWMGDVNGDGRDDIAAFGNRATYVSLGTGSGFGPPAEWIRCYGPSAGGWSDYDTYPRVLGDVNGDGKDDIVAFGNRATYVSLSTGSAFGPPTPWILCYGPAAGGWVSQDLYPRVLGDVDGDGKDDIIAFGVHATYVSLSTGTGFQPPSPWIYLYGTSAGGWSSYDTFPRMVDDVDGNGRDDIVAFGNRATYVSLSTGSSFGSPTPWAQGLGPAAGGWNTQDGQTRLVGDIDGDHRADIVAFGHTTTYAWRSSANTLGVCSWFYTNEDGWVSQNSYPRDLGDVDGDGKVDIVGFGSDGAYVQQMP